LQQKGLQLNNQTREPNIFTIITIILFLLSVIVVNLQAKETYPDVCANNIVSVYDGDTIKVDINSYPDVIGKGVSIRVANIDTPELRGAKCELEKGLGLLARDFAIVFMNRCNHIMLRNVQRDKYFRLVAEVHCENQSLGDELIKVNLAYPYTGGTKQSWCN
jgi:micrococcal nuclease